MTERNDDGSHHFSHPGLTAREHAAITLRVPDSGQEWLDDMIREARRWDAAQAAMQGILASPDGGENTPESLARCAVADTDALFAALKAEG